MECGGVQGGLEWHAENGLGRWSVALRMWRGRSKSLVAGGVVVANVEACGALSL